MSIQVLIKEINENNISGEAFHLQSGFSVLFSGRA